MRFSKTRALALSLPLAVLALGCSGPTVGDIVEQQVTLDVAGVYMGQSSIPSGDERGDFSMSRALLSTSGMTLVPCASGAGEISIAARVYDLLATKPFGEGVTTAVTEYCSLRVDLAPVSDATDGMPAGDSLLLEAQDASGPLGPYEGEDSPSLTFTADDGSSFGDQPLLLGFDLSGWLDYLAGNELDPNPGLFDSTLSDVAALYVDANGNDKLDADEQTPIARGKPSR
jgi:hypothetical protein